MKSITRKAEADWKGNLEKGHGLVTTGSCVLRKQPFSFGRRIDSDDGTETNPEELIAAGVASCFSMALSKTLEDAGSTAIAIVVTAEVTLSITDAGPKVSVLKLNAAVMIGGLTQETLEDAVEKTRKNCPVFKLLEPGFETVEVTASLEG